MRCVSTRAPRGEGTSLTEAITRGLAPDGGLYVPERIPWLAESLRDPAALAALADVGLDRVAEAVLAPWFEGEALAAALGPITRAAFSFDAPVVELGSSSSPLALLELFHGPTAAFKDFGARFLAELMARSPADGPRTILVATSGDTGAAVAAAFHGRPGVRVVVLYPDGRVSARQAHQLGAFGDNVSALRVAGSFDDCQRLVKSAFQVPALVARHGLASANSISLGRLLPQLVYHAAGAARAARAWGVSHVGLVVPTGNLGNGLAALLARAMGAPIGPIALATNANRVVPDWRAGAPVTARLSIPTLANAMDVGVPSNLERLTHLFPGAQGDATLLADAVDDAAIRARIAETYVRFGQVVCPHTACGLEVVARRTAAGDTQPWVVAATAHPAKFETIVEPLVGRVVPPPPALAALLARPASAAPMEVSDAALGAALG